MSTKTYYISVQGESILEEQGAAAYEFEINATEDEVDSLQLLFEDKDDMEQHSAYRAITPGISYHDDQENDEVDETLQRIYQEIYRLGTEETKKHIKKMNILPQK